MVSSTSSPSPRTSSTTRPHAPFTTGLQAGLLPSVAPAHRTSRPTEHVVSVAYAGTDLPVHMVLSRRSPSGLAYHKVELSYPAFNRFVRERMDRTLAVALMTALGNLVTVDPDTGFRTWGTLQTAALIPQSSLDMAPISSSIAA